MIPEWNTPKPKHRKEEGGWSDKVTVTQEMFSHTGKNSQQCWTGEGQGGGV